MTTPDIQSLVESVPHRHEDDAHVRIPAGWRLLNLGEEIIDGDKHWRATIRDWEYTNWTGCKVTPRFDTYIRREDKIDLATEVLRLRAELAEAKDAAAWIIADPQNKLSPCSLKFLRAMNGAMESAYDDLRNELAEEKRKVEPKWLPELRTFLADFVEHIGAVPERKLLALDSDPHPPSVMSVMRDTASRLLAALTTPSEKGEIK